MPKIEDMAQHKTPRRSEPLTQHLRTTTSLEPVLNLKHQALGNQLPIHSATVPHRAPESLVLTHRLTKLPLDRQATSLASQPLQHPDLYLVRPPQALLQVSSVRQQQVLRLSARIPQQLLVNLKHKPKRRILGCSPAPMPLARISRIRLPNHLPLAAAHQLLGRIQAHPRQISLEARIIPQPIHLDRARLLRQRIHLDSRPLLQALDSVLEVQIRPSSQPQASVSVALAIRTTQQPSL